VLEDAQREYEKFEGGETFGLWSGYDGAHYPGKGEDFLPSA